MALRIEERLDGRAVEGGLRVGPERIDLADVLFDLPAGLGRDLGRRRRDRVGEAEILEGRRPDAPDDRARLLDRLPQEVRGALHVGLGLHGVLEDPVRRDDHRREAVMELARDVPPRLLFLR